MRNLLDELFIYGFNDNHFKALYSFFLSAVVFLFLFPYAYKIAIRKTLFTKPNRRSSHQNPTPYIGGILIFLCFLISLSVVAPQLLVQYPFLLSGITAFCVIGFIDDALEISAYKKLFIQLLFAFIFIVIGGIKIESFNGLFGIYELPEFLKNGFSIFVFLLIINAFNLIDGVDGLASGLSIVSFTGFLFIFYRLHFFEFGVVCLAFIGALLCFIYFNIWSRFKIFLGDSGSLLLGFSLAFCTIYFLNVSHYPSVFIPAAPLIAMAIISIPLIDTFGVIAFRAIKRQPLFLAGKDHLHHRLLNLGLNHKQTTLAMILANFLIMMVCYLLHAYNINFIFMVLVLISLMVLFAPNAWLLIQKIRRTAVHEK